MAYNNQSHHRRPLLKRRKNTEEYIGENTTLIYDLMAYTEILKISGLLVIDFEKAFDSLEWEFINKVLNFWGFGIKYNYLVEFLSS